MTDFFRPVSDLGDRYQIDLSDVHARIKFLGMVPEDLNGKAFIDANELKVMDALDAHIKAGRDIADFEQRQS
ncbi:hypothetical protein C7B65_12375 [Phormidesmis priestleyi ULC007]|uniref:Uncharacterized protein n=1 Tax=Phormidesmis priestleyi ULC007 TaxID=1920490 RepID=A0A2T1DF24_9CYAN|nr:hypothetical protein [Phormidesmis priestleyi]PSB19076.1 hypothetical protein C7B65_12375 [Phormidesmis priestleyi ULC007]PZO46063.1 MAG: hypothetical protein DCF14_23875 [Phormidesmis priestleyi]